MSEGEPSFQLKPLHRDAVPAALEKVQQYRLLNEPRAAESICLDILEVEPENQTALVQLVLALTDQFDAAGFGKAERRAKQLLSRIRGKFEHTYYAGIICERRAKAQIRMGILGHAVYDSLREAMSHYEEAEKLQPSATDDAILRWNACARLIMQSPSLKPDAETKERYEPYFE